MANDRQIYILRTTDDVFNKFFINNSNSLIHEEIKQGEVVSRNEIINNIKEYSAAIDSEDKIHVIYTDDNVNLKYMVLTQNNNTVNIVSAKKNHILRCINLKIIQKTPHIFYALTDLQNNSHIICQSSFVNDTWQCNEIFKAIGPRYIQPYLLEIHSREIYLLLYLNYFEGRLALLKMDKSKVRFEEIDRNIQLKDSINLSFFISPKNMMVIAYNKLINRNFQTIIIYRSLTTKNYEAWETKVISNKNTNTFKPFIFFNNDKYYMTWVQGDKVVLIGSKDLISWEDIVILDKDSKEFPKCCYMSNQSQDSDLKMNIAYLSNTINLCPLINLKFKNEIPKMNLASDSGHSLENFPVQAKTFVQEPETLIEETEIFTEEPETLIEEAETFTEEPETLIEEAETFTEEPETLIVKPKTFTEEPETFTEEVRNFIEEPNFIEQPNFSIEEFLFFIKETNIFIQKPENFLEEKIKILDEKLEKKVNFLDNELKEKTYENISMKKNINYLNNIITLNEEQIIWLNNAKTSSTQDISIRRNSFLDKIISFHKERDTLLFSYNNKLWKLFSLIEEKDKLIDDLYKRINK